MELEDAIRTRKSVPKVTERRPAKEEIEALLTAAVRAPNHYLTQPWRFIVLAGAALDELGDAMAIRVREEFAGAPDREQRVQMEHSRATRAPVIITVIYHPSEDEKVVEIEDRYAVGGAIGYILLTAHARGLGAYTRTGPAATDPNVARFLELEDKEEVAGFVYVGYPDGEIPPVTERAPAGERTIWRGWDL